jgi:hypothetical protein
VFKVQQKTFIVAKSIDGLEPLDVLAGKLGKQAIQDATVRVAERIIPKMVK